MNRLIANAGTIVVLAGLVVAGQPVGDGPHDRQNLVRPAPNDPSKVPEARAEDVASLDAIVGAFYSSISAGAGEPRDWDRVRSLFIPGARMLAARSLPSGGAGVWPLKVDEFIDANQRYFERGGYYEAEVGRRVEEYGNIAHVWSTYEARKNVNSAKPYARGIYSIQLLKGGTRWWIVDMYWDYERPEVPIPEKYLEGGGR